MLGIAGAGGGITFQVIDIIGGGVPVEGDEIGVLLFFEVMQSPVLAVEEDDSESGGLGFHAEIGSKALHEFIPHESQVMIMAGRAEEEVLELGAGAIGENAMAERLAAFASGGVEVEAFNWEILGGVTVDFDIAVLGEGDCAIGFDEFDMDRSLPVITALRVIAARGSSGNVDAESGVEEVFRWSGERNDRDRVTGVAFWVNKESAGDGAAGEGAGLEGFGANGSAFKHGSAGRGIAGHGWD